MYPFYWRRTLTHFSSEILVLQTHLFLYYYYYYWKTLLGVLKLSYMRFSNIFQMLLTKKILLNI